MTKKEIKELSNEDLLATISSLQNVNGENKKSKFWRIFWTVTKVLVQLFLEKRRRKL